MTAQYLIKIALSAALILAVNEVAKRHNGWAALIHSLPWTSVLILIWMNYDKMPAAKIDEHCRLVFWYVIPTLPMFLLFGKMMSHVGFWGALAGYALGTYLLFLLTIRLARAFGVGM
jgi:hypothetical protein